MVRLLPNLKALGCKAVEHLEELLEGHTGRARAEVQRFIADRILLYPAPLGISCWLT